MAGQSFFLGDDAANVQEISWTNFLAMEEEQFKSISNAIETSFMQSVQRKLQVIGYKQDELEELARDILYEGVEIYENTEEQGKDVRELRDIGSIHSELDDRAFLMMYAPRDKSPQVPLSYQQDAQARKLQYASFCSIYPGIESNPTKNPTELVKIDDYEEMKTELQKFFGKYVGKAKKLIVIFNGHGSANGLALSQEQHPVSLDKYITYIKELLNSGSGDQLDAPGCPQAVDIVFAQCFGHCFTQPRQDGVIEVIALTTKEKPTTRFRVVWEKTAEGLKTGTVQKSWHEGLNKHAQKKKEEAEAQGQPKQGAVSDETTQFSTDTQVEYMETGQ